MDLLLLHSDTEFYIWFDWKTMNAMTLSCNFRSTSDRNKIYSCISNYPFMIWKFNFNSSNSTGIPLLNWEFNSTERASFSVNIEDGWHANFSHFRLFSTSPPDSIAQIASRLYSENQLNEEFLSEFIFFQTFFLTFSNANIICFNNTDSYMLQFRVLYCSLFGFFTWTDDLPRWKQNKQPTEFN